MTCVCSLGIRLAMLMYMTITGDGQLAQLGVCLDYFHLTKFTVLHSFIFKELVCFEDDYFLSLPLIGLVIIQFYAGVNSCTIDS